MKPLLWSANQSFARLAHATVRHLYAEHRTDGWGYVGNMHCFGRPAVANAPSVQCKGDVCIIRIPLPVGGTFVVFARRDILSACTRHEEYVAAALLVVAIYNHIAKRLGNTAG